MSRNQKGGFRKRRTKRPENRAGKNLFGKGVTKGEYRHLLNFLKYFVCFENEDVFEFEQILDYLTGKTFPIGIKEYLLLKEISSHQLMLKMCGHKIINQNALHDLRFIVVGWVDVLFTF